MKIKHIALTQDQFDSICQSFDWRIEELTLNTLKLIPKLIRPHQALGGFISGSLVQPKTLNDYDSVAGIDILAHEPNPHTSKDEFHLNAYHYIIQKTGHPVFPYILRGPFRDETLIGHWPNDLNLDCYFR